MRLLKTSEYCIDELVNNFKLLQLKLRGSKRNVSKKKFTKRASF